MGRRRKAREYCLQVLFQLEFHPESPSVVLDEFWSEKKVPLEVREYTEWLVKGISARREFIDELIQSVSQHWKLERMSVVDRNILRLAVFEFLEESHIPPAIIINEAIEIAKKFSTEKAGVFVNGILDAVRKKLESGDVIP
jgi:N utilization substance protein B